MSVYMIYHLYCVSFFTFVTERNNPSVANQMTRVLNTLRTCTGNYIIGSLMLCPALNFLWPGRHEICKMQRS